MAKSKKTIADEAVKAALESAQVFVDVDAPEGEADALIAADEALSVALGAVEDAGTADDHAASIAAVRAMIDPDAAAKEGAAAAVAAAADRAAAAAAGPKPVDWHTIAPGHAITTKRGILAPGDRIGKDDLPGGSKALKAFVKSGHVLKPNG